MLPHTYLARAAPRAWHGAFAVVILVACILRLAVMQRYGFDVDEVFSLETISSSWSDLFSIAAHDVSHPPLFYIALKLWLILGPVHEAWARLLPMMFGVGSLE
jgi:hypothetical protein